MKAKGGKKMTEIKEKWKVLEFDMPIIETAIVNEKDMKIKGTAINEVTTRNNVKYIASELEAAVPSFRNVPILLDHKNEVRSIVGRSTDNVVWNSAKRAIEFEAIIQDAEIQKMINDGRITNVSIGAAVNDLVEQEDGSVLATGIQGLELSLVAISGDPNASIAMAMANNFVIKEKLLEGKDLAEDIDIDKAVDEYCKKTENETIVLEVVL